VTAGEPSAWKKFVRYMTVAEDESSGESRAWKVFRAMRWTAALIVVVLAALATRHDICSTTTTIRTGLGIFSGLPKTESAQVCSRPGLSDLVGYFVIVAVLLLPDTRSIAIGGLQFERLTSQVKDVAKDVSELRQTITITIGASLVDEAKAQFKNQKATLDQLRVFLPDEARTIERLRRVDNFTQDLDDAQLIALIRMMETIQDLIDEAKQATEALLARQGAAGDTAEEVAGAQEAGEVVRKILNPDA
jgi:hypothetical protein